MSIILRTLAQRSRDMHPSSDTIAVCAPGEKDRLPMIRRGIKLALLKNLLSDLIELERRDINSGQFLNGIHTTDSATDWKEFDRDRDAYSGKACCLHTGVSFVETMVEAGLTHDPATGAAYFSDINTFVSYSWRGSGASLADLIVSVEDALTAKGHEVGAIYIDPNRNSTLLHLLLFVVDAVVTVMFCCSCSYCCCCCCCCCYAGGLCAIS